MKDQVFNNEKYFALEDTDKIGDRLIDRVTDYYDYISSNGYCALWQKVHAQFYRGYFNNGEIQPYGELGEKQQLDVNHFRNLIEHIKVLTVHERPVFQPRAINNDYNSYVQTKFSASLLDYYMRQEGLEDVIDGAMDYGLLGGEGFVFGEWDKNQGEIVAEMDFDEEEDKEEDVDEEGEEEEGEDFDPIEKIKRVGNAKFRSFHPIDVIRDVNKDTVEDNNWYIFRIRVNKFELAAKYPKKRKEIIHSPESMDGNNVKTCVLDTYDQKRLTTSDQIYTFVFRHAITSAVPLGRQVEFLEDGEILFDGDLPYNDMFAYPLRPSCRRGSNFGYTVAYDMLPIQTAITMLDSIITTNQNAFGVQNILSKKGSNVVSRDLAAGLKNIEFSGDVPPVPLKLLSTAPEIFNYKNDLIQQMETISGVNSVSRGNPEASLKSGAALALVQSMAIQFNSGLQNAYVKALEKTGTGLISVIKKYASEPRIALIAGEGSKGYLKEFSSKNVDKIDAVIVDVGNPMSKTLPGKMAIADTLIQNKFVKSGDQYISLLETGRLSPIIESESLELMSIRSENEVLLNSELGEDRPAVTAYYTDNHSLHIREHSGVISSVEARNDAEIIKRVDQHIQQHVDLLRTTDPGFLMLNGQQPLPPMQVAPPVPNQDIPNTPTSGQNQQPTPPGDQGIPGAEPTLEGEMPNMPSMPKNALTGQEFNNETGGL